MPFPRRTLLASAASAAILRAGTSRAIDPITAGVSGPLTGPNAQYGAQWKRGFDLALETINKTGIKGRPIEYDFQDSQSDPRQSVAVAQKFVSDPRVIIELGDFSSPASMAASPIYQRAKLVQFGFTNSHPDFTKGGDHMWSNSTNQAEEQPHLAEFAAKRLQFKRPALLHLNTDWGRTAKDAFLKAAPDNGMEVVAVEGYLSAEQDFRPTLVRVRDAKPDGVVLLSYYADGALIARQARDTGLALPMLAGTSNYSPKFIELGGAGVEGVFIMSNFFPGDPRPEVQEFVKIFRAKYDMEPDSFCAGSYDTMNLFATLCDRYGTTREAMQTGLMEIKDVPSVIYGKMTFNTETRRVQGANYRLLVVKDGKFQVSEGIHA